MNNIIKLLPDHVANQIAAGEVIQRPASVVKELLENSIDAGADKIQLILKDSGKLLIRVVDNGKGMSAEDARIAFERHATSKISSGDDLFSIKTMGFRGEALASIAAVARVELTTQSPDSDLGTLIRIEGSEVVQQEPFAGLPGTSISVKDLFYNIPARRKFLKSEKVELRRIIQEFERIALGFPGISFTLFNDDKEMMRLPAGNTKERIINLFGKNLTDKLFRIEEETDFLKLTGFGVKPQFCKKSRKDQYLFLNQRFFKSGYLHHAIKGAYEGLLQADEQPSYFLFLEMDPSLVDVNVHPTKQEIKFQDERMMYNLIRVTVRHGLGKHQLTPTLDFDSEVGHAELGGQEMFRTSGGSFSGKTNTGTGSDSSGPAYRPPGEKKDSAENWNEIFEGVRKEIEQGPSAFQHTVDGNEQTSGYGQVFQVLKRFVAVQTVDGLLLIDQLKAHEEMLYRQFLVSIENESGNSQNLLFPQTVEVAQAEVPILEELLPFLQNTGFQLEHFGGNTFVIHGLPSIWSDDADPDELLNRLLENYRLTGELKEVKKRIAQSLAKSLRIKSYKQLSETEMHLLVDSCLNNRKDSDSLYPSSSILLDATRLANLFKK